MEDVELAVCGRRIYRLWGPNYLEKDVAPLEENQIRKLGKKSYHRDFPGSPVVKALPFNAGGAASIPGEGAKIQHASQPKKQKYNEWKT